MMSMMAGLVLLNNTISSNEDLPRLTVYTLLNMTADETLQVRNIHGQEFQIQKSFLKNVLIFSWIFQILAICVNLGGYLIHPMAVEKSISSKLFVHVFGTRYSFMTCKMKRLHTMRASIT